MDRISLLPSDLGFICSQTILLWQKSGSLLKVCFCISFLPGWWAQSREFVKNHDFGRNRFGSCFGFKSNCHHNVNKESSSSSWYRFFEAKSIVKQSIGSYKMRCASQATVCVRVYFAFISTRRNTQDWETFRISYFLKNNRGKMFSFLPSFWGDQFWVPYQNRWWRLRHGEWNDLAEENPWRPQCR